MVLKSAVTALVRNTKPTDKPQKLFDGGGLFLLVTPAGQRYWRLKYRVAGKENLLAPGTYPAVSLASARKKRDEHHQVFQQDPVKTGNPRQQKASRPYSRPACPEALHVALSGKCGITA